MPLHARTYRQVMPEADKTERCTNIRDTWFVAGVRWNRSIIGVGLTRIILWRYSSSLNLSVMVPATAAGRTEYVDSVIQCLCYKDKSNSTLSWNLRYEAISNVITQCIVGKFDQVTSSHFA